MKQRVSIGGWAATLVAGCLALSSCVPGTNVDGSTGSQDAQKPEKGPQTIEFWTINLKQNYQSYVQGMIDGYEAKHKDVTVKWVDVPG
ncbi:MAG TPA: hypothetical protein VE287_09955, partial [Actinopolymorphaceae bacterium]|nr:hypothetical protein [Actinopolymorphaceae bacterium]